MARPVSPKGVPPFERLPASRRFQQKCGDVIAPWIEDSGSTVLQILRVARNQIEVRLDRRRRKQGIDNGRRMTRFSFHTPGNGPPAMDDGVVERQYSANWSEVLRLATSIRSGAVQASALLKKLSGYPRQNGLAVALRDIGRIERSLFMLGWYSDPELRRRTGLGLNKGEARNTLARAIFFNRLGELRDRSFENQAYRASGLNLIVAAIILWNTRYLAPAFAELARRGHDVSSELIRHVAPPGWQHIALTGDYSWNLAAPLAPDALRPLRNESSILGPHEFPIRCCERSVKCTFVS